MEAASADSSMRWRVARSLSRSEHHLDAPSIPPSNIAFEATAALLRAQELLRPVYTAGTDQAVKHALEVLVYEDAAEEVVVRDFFPEVPDRSLENTPDASGAFSRVFSVEELVFRVTGSTKYTDMVGLGFRRGRLLGRLHGMVRAAFGVEEGGGEPPSLAVAPDIDYAVFREQYAYLCSAAILVRISDKAKLTWRDWLLADEMIDALSDPLQLLASLLLPSDGEDHEFGEYVLQSIERPALDIASMMEKSMRASKTVQEVAKLGRKVPLAGRAESSYTD